MISKERHSPPSSSAASYYIRKSRLFSAIFSDAAAPVKAVFPAYCGKKAGLRPECTDLRLYRSIDAHQCKCRNIKDNASTQRSSSAPCEYAPLPPCCAAPVCADGRLPLPPAPQGRRASQYSHPSQQKTPLPYPYPLFRQ